MHVSLLFYCIITDQCTGASGELAVMWLSHIISLQRFSAGKGCHVYRIASTVRHQRLVHAVQVTEQVQRLVLHISWFLFFQLYCQSNLVLIWLSRRSWIWYDNKMKVYATDTTFSGRLWSLERCHLGKCTVLFDIQTDFQQASLCCVWSKLTVMVYLSIYLLTYFIHLQSTCTDFDRLLQRCRWPSRDLRWGLI